MITIERHARHHSDLMDMLIGGGRVSQADVDCSVNTVRHLPQVPLRLLPKPIVWNVYIRQYTMQMKTRLLTCRCGAEDPDHWHPLHLALPKLRVTHVQSRQRAGHVVICTNNPHREHAAGGSGRVTHTNASAGFAVVYVVDAFYVIVLIYMTYDYGGDAAVYTVESDV